MCERAAGGASADPPKPSLLYASAILLMIRSIAREYAAILRLAMILRTVAMWVGSRVFPPAVIKQAKQGFARPPTLAAALATT